MSGSVELDTSRISIGSLNRFPLVPPIEGSVLFEEIGRSKLHPLSRVTCISPNSPAEYYGLWDSSEALEVHSRVFPASKLEDLPVLGDNASVEDRLGSHKGTFDEKIAVPVALNEHFVSGDRSPLRVHHRDALANRTSPGSALKRSVSGSYITFVSPIFESNGTEKLTFDASQRSFASSVASELSESHNAEEIQVTRSYNPSADVESQTLVHQIYDVVADHCISALKAASERQPCKGKTFVVTGLDSFERFYAMREELHLVLWAIASLLRHFDTHHLIAVSTSMGSHILRSSNQAQLDSELALQGERRQEALRIARKKGRSAAAAHHETNIATLQDTLDVPPQQTPFDFIYSSLSSWFLRVVVVLPHSLGSYPLRLVRHVSETLAVNARLVEYSPLSAAVDGKTGFEWCDIKGPPIATLFTNDGFISAAAVDAVVSAAIDFMIELHNDNCDEAGNTTQVVPVFVPSPAVAKRVKRAMDDQYTSEPVRVIAAIEDTCICPFVTTGHSPSSGSLIFLICDSSSGLPKVVHGGNFIPLEDPSVDRQALCIQYEGQSSTFCIRKAVHLGMSLNEGLVLAERKSVVNETLSLCRLMNSCSHGLQVHVPQVSTSDGVPVVRRGYVNHARTENVVRLGKCILELGRRLRCAEDECQQGQRTSAKFYREFVLAGEQQSKLRANRRVERQRDQDAGIESSQAEEISTVTVAPEVDFQQPLPRDVDPRSQMFISLRYVVGPQVGSEASHIGQALHFLIHGDFIVPTQMVRPTGSHLSLSFVPSSLGQRIASCLTPAMQHLHSSMTLSLTFMKYAICAVALGISEFSLATRLSDRALINQLEVLVRIPFRSLHLDPSPDSATVLEAFCESWSRYPLAASEGRRFIMSPFVEKRRLVTPRELLNASLGSQTPCRGWYTEGAPVVVPQTVLRRDGEFEDMGEEGNTLTVAIAHEVDEIAILSKLIQRNVASQGAAQVVSDAKKKTRQKRGRRVESTPDTMSNRVAGVATSLGVSLEVDLSRPGMEFMRALDNVARFPSVLSEVVQVCVPDPVSQLIGDAFCGWVTLPCASLDLSLVIKTTLRNAVSNACILMDGPSLQLADRSQASTLGSTIASQLRGSLNGETVDESFEALLASMVAMTVLPLSKEPTARLHPTNGLAISRLPPGLSRSSTVCGVIDALMHSPCGFIASIWADSLSSAFGESGLPLSAALARDNLMHNSSTIPSLSAVCAHTQFRSIDVTKSVKDSRTLPNDMGADKTPTQFGGVVPERGEDKIIEKVIQSIKKLGRAKVERASKGKPLFGFLDPTHSLHPYYLHSLRLQGVIEK